jgi:AcrR family transcriptional regulator
MPKRDAAYMQQQRDLIAHAALEVMLERGIYGTSLRDICERASVSMGALYIHFATKEEAVVAAFALDNARRKDDRAAVDRRADYLEAWRHDLNAQWNDQYELRRMRLSIQFIADMTLVKENPAGLSDIYRRGRRWVEQSLRMLKQNGEATLPLGLEQTLNAHHRLAIGTNYMVLGHKDLDRTAALDTMTATMDLTLGPPRRPGKRATQDNERG